MTMRCTLVSIGLVLCCSATTALAATAQRTFVGAAGSDNPSCSLVAPCRSFGAAVGATSPGGEVVVLDSAGYGPVTITKSVSIIAPPGIYAGVSVFPGFAGVTVNAPGATVVLRGLSINGQGGGPGIGVQAAGRVRVEGCVVSNLTGNGIDHSAAGAEMTVLDTVVRDNSGQGIQIDADGSAVLDHVRSEHNGVQGLAVAPASAEASVTVGESVFSYNGVNGVIVTTGPGTQAFVQVERSVMSNNAGSGFFAFASSSGGTVKAMLFQNAINRNAVDGVLLNTIDPGSIEASISGNAIQANQVGLHVKGNNASTFATANTVNFIRSTTSTATSRRSSSARTTTVSRKS